MSDVYLNGSFMPASEARISPMDRGFLFGDGIYEVIPSYQGKLVGFTPHIDRMQRGLAEIGIQFDWSHMQWLDMINELLMRNGNGDLGVYLHVSRGTDSKRGHAFPAGVTPTVFAFCLYHQSAADRFAGFSQTYSGRLGQRFTLETLSYQINGAAW